jgi:Ca2+-binding RTX toxin-like protein
LELCLSTLARGCDTTCECSSDNGEANEGDTLVNVERIWGGAGDDVLIGTKADEAIYGEDGDDAISAGAGSDTLQGGGGNDSLDGGDGGDICDAEKDEVSLSCEI